MTTFWAEFECSLVAARPQGPLSTLRAFDYAIGKFIAVHHVLGLQILCRALRFFIPSGRRPLLADKYPPNAEVAIWDRA
jgi:hypothetical protein